MMHRVFTGVWCLVLACCTAQAASTLVVPDQFSSIQEAVAEAQAGDTVHIKAGIYTVETPIELKSGLVLSGEGRDVVSIHSKEETGQVLLLEAVDNIKISQITFGRDKSDKEKEEQGESEEAKGPPIVLVKGSSVEISDCTFKGGATDGLRIKKGSKALVKNCRAEGNSRNGILIGDDETSVTIADNECVGNKGTGIYFDGSQGIVEGNVCSENSYGIGVSKESAEVVIRQNKCNDNEKIGIFIQKGADADVENNTCSRNGWTGMLIDGKGTAPTIRGNTCSENVKTGMYYRKGGAGLAEGNTCSGNGEDGIEVQDSQDQVTLRGNLCENNKRDGISVICGGIASLENNTCNNNTRRGIFIAYAGTKAFVVANKCSQNGGNGISIDCGAEATVANNVFSKNAASGICVMFFDTAPIIENNESSENDGHGIWFGWDAEGTARGNKFHDNKKAGIFVLSKDAKPVLENNECRGNVDGEVFHDRESHYDGVYTYESEIGWLFRSENFARLERIVERLRKVKPRLVTGEWQLEDYYDFLQTKSGNAGRFYSERHFEVLNNWIEAYPDSVTPRIALVNQYRYLGWKARGGGYANTVTEEGWKGFHENLDKAEEVLLEAEKLEQKDPELYAAMVVVGMGNGWSDRKIKKAFQKGVSVEVNYYALFRAYCDSLLPRWGGRYGDVERFADEAVQITRDSEGEAMYALIASNVQSYVRSADYVKVHDFSWSRVQKGFDDFLEAHPNSLNRLNDYCQMACLHKDQEKASELFERIGKNRHPYLWRNEEEFHEWKRWAMGTGEYPELEEPHSPDYHRKLGQNDSGGSTE